MNPWLSQTHLWTCARLLETDFSHFCSQVSVLSVKEFVRLCAFYLCGQGCVHVRFTHPHGCWYGNSHQECLCSTQRASEGVVWGREREAGEQGSRCSHGDQTVLSCLRKGGKRRRGVKDRVRRGMRWDKPGQPDVSPQGAVKDGKDHGTLGRWKFCLQPTVLIFILLLFFFLFLCVLVFDVTHLFIVKFSIHVLMSLCEHPLGVLLLHTRCCPPSLCMCQIVCVCSQFRSDPKRHL